VFGGLTCGFGGKFEENSFVGAKGEILGF
jgi:hypothetical protein